MTPETLMVLTLAVPLAGAAVISQLGPWPNLRESATLLTAAVLFAVNLALAWDVLGGARPEIVLAGFIPGAPILLGAEPLGVIFGLVASCLWIVTSVYAIGYMRGKHEDGHGFLLLQLLEVSHIAHQRHVVGGGGRLDGAAAPAQA